MVALELLASVFRVLAGLGSALKTVFSTTTSKPVVGHFDFLIPQTMRAQHLGFNENSEYISGKISYDTRS